MKKRVLFWISGTFFSLATIWSVSISALNKKENIDNDYSFNTLIQKNEEENQNNNILNVQKNMSKVISISTGFDGLCSDEERMLYQKIKSGCGKISNQQSNNAGMYSIDPISVDGKKLRVDQIKKVLYAIQNDIPEVFWISSSFGYGYHNNKSNVIKLNSNFSKTQKEYMQNELKNKVSDIISKVPSNATDYEKELILHNYVVKNCKYKNETGNSKIFTSYGCLIEGKAVCEGYSKAIQLLLSQVGVECRTIVGAKGKEAHMWNLVKIDGKWYHLDATWDATDNWQQYNYFNLDDKTIKIDHSINEQFNASEIFENNRRYNFLLPVCNSKNYNYYEMNAIKYSKFKNDENVFVNYIAKCASAKNKYFYIQLDNNENLENFKNNFFSSKIFNYLSTANKIVPEKNKIDFNKLSYSIFKPQNVIIVKMNYVNV